MGDELESRLKVTEYPDFAGLLATARIASYAETKPEFLILCGSV
jgi:hypothetical protein